MDLKLLLKQVHMLHLKLFDMLLHMLHMLQLKRLDMLLDNLLCHQGWLHKMGGKKNNQVHLTQGAEHGATSTVAMSIMKGKDNLQTTVAS
jgi:hypothetical protein